MIGNAYWRKTKTVIQQANEALEKKRVLYGILNNEEVENDSVGLITRSFSFGEVYFENFGSKTRSGFVKFNKFKRIYDGYFIDHELTDDEKKYKDKYSSL